MTSILGIIIFTLACWWLLVSYDKMTKPFADTKPAQPCPHCGQRESEIGGSYRCPHCRNTRHEYGLVDKP